MMGRSGYLNLEVSIANVRTVIVVEMKHNTDHTVTHVSTKRRLLAVKYTSSPHLGTQISSSYLSTRIKLLLSTFLVSFLHIANVLIAPTLVLLGFICPVSYSVVGAAVDLTVAHGPGSFPNRSNKSLYEGSILSTFFNNSVMLMGRCSRFCGAMHNLVGSLLARGSP